MDCPFCRHPGVVLQNELAVAVYDKYPVSRGHMLVLPRRHFTDIFQAGPDEIGAMWDLLHRCRLYLDEKYGPQGYNVGVNCGHAAGQTVPHVHVHLIPRYTGDVPDPTGGVRGVIPARRIYPLAGFTSGPAPSTRWPRK